MQYQRITQLCGSPEDELLDKIEADNSAAMRIVIQSFKRYKRQDFKKYFREHSPSDEFIDLIEKLLVLDPEKRISVEEAIAHPYLAEFALPDDEPRAESVFDLHDEYKRTSNEWKEVIWKEVINYERLDSSPIVPAPPADAQPEPEVE